LYNGKELDEETGLYYYGARYYDARTSVWQSVDPFADKYAALSPFAYVANNPIILIDPDGKKIKGVTYDKKTKTFTYTEEALKNGTDKYIEARMETKIGQRAVSKFLNQRKEFTIIVTEKLLVSSSEGGKYSLSNGETERSSNTMVISTNSLKVEEIPTEGVKAVTLKDGKLIDVNINQSNVIQGLVDTGSDYSLAYTDSGMRDFDLKNPYKKTKEMINGTASHEEVHFSNYGNNGDAYYSESNAFKTEKRNRIEYIKKVYGEKPNE
jgi:RHS repeat-associated protein